MSLDPEQQTRVLDSAVELFTHHELNSITIDQITEISGVSAFDLVRHYRSKENLLASVLDRELELMSAAAYAPVIQAAPSGTRDGASTEAGRLEAKQHQGDRPAASLADCELAGRRRGLIANQHRALSVEESRSPGNLCGVHTTVIGSTLRGGRDSNPRGPFRGLER